MLLDCCYSGAYSGGLAPRSGGSADVESEFQGEGLAVITASDAMEYAWETGGKVTLDEPRPSVFTTQIVRGLQTGGADLDQDGEISVSDLYDYVYEQVRLVTPNQTPTKSESGLKGNLLIAKSVRAPRASPPCWLPCACAAARTSSSRGCARSARASASSWAWPSGQPCESSLVGVRSFACLPPLSSPPGR